MSGTWVGDDADSVLDTSGSLLGGGTGEWQRRVLLEQQQELEEFEVIERQILGQSAGEPGASSAGQNQLFASNGQAGNHQQLGRTGNIQSTKFDGSMTGGGTQRDFHSPSRNVRSSKKDSVSGWAYLDAYLNSDEDGKDSDGFSHHGFSTQEKQSDNHSRWLGGTHDSAQDEAGYGESSMPRRSAWSTDEAYATQHASNIAQSSSLSHSRSDVVGDSVSWGAVTRPSLRQVMREQEDEDEEEEASEGPQITQRPTNPSKSLSNSSIPLHHTMPARRPSPFTRSNSTGHGASQLNAESDPNSASHATGPQTPNRTQRGSSSSSYTSGRSTSLADHASGNRRAASPATGRKHTVPGDKQETDEQDAALRDALALKAKELESELETYRYVI